MILFLGTRPGKTTTARLHSIACPYCGQRDTLVHSHTPNYFHIFWLPLFTIQTIEHVECRHCKRVYSKEEYPVEIREHLDR